MPLLLEHGKVTHSPESETPLLVFRTTICCLDGIFQVARVFNTVDLISRYHYPNSNHELPGAGCVPVINLVMVENIVLGDDTWNTLGTSRPAVLSRAVEICS